MLNQRASSRERSMPMPQRRSRDQRRVRFRDLPSQLLPSHQRLSPQHDLNRRLLLRQRLLRRRQRVHGGQPHLQLLSMDGHPRRSDLRNPSILVLRGLLRPRRLPHWITYRLLQVHLLHLPQRNHCGNQHLEHRPLVLWMHSIKQHWNRIMQP